MKRGCNRDSPICKKLSMLQFMKNFLMFEKNAFRYMKKICDAGLYTTLGFSTLKLLPLPLFGSIVSRYSNTEKEIIYKLEL